MIANNMVDGAAVGVAVTNFNQGGRFAVVQGNSSATSRRSAGRHRPERRRRHRHRRRGRTAVTGNVIENAPSVGISVGCGRYLRDVTVTGNVVRTPASASRCRSRPAPARR